MSESSSITVYITFLLTEILTFTDLIKTMTCIQLLPILYHIYYKISLGHQPPSIVKFLIKLLYQVCWFSMPL